jgi:hypothetical protein
MSMLSVMPAYGLPTRAEEQRWLVKDLWSEQAVGIIGAEPQCCKTFLALDLAVAVAAGAPCLRRFPVSRAVRVLYAAEDPLDMVRRRLEGICADSSLKLAKSTSRETIRHRNDARSGGGLESCSHAFRGRPVTMSVAEATSKSTASSLGAGSRDAPGCRA